ncbi:MAG TPA: 4-hydroxy-tetrahydrodipicolinate synthase [Polyangiales bacterium]|jgi:4-hydroxy-tetrahydrodipicolinate synthase|nr:4-hydroxy-tetrahydrodipicolinate synthase [Polyangiales bacterium]
MATFEGALTALITPFRDDRLDEKALRALVAEQIEGGIDGLVPSGTTGESASLSHDEYARVLELVIDEARGRVPVIAGAGSASTAHAIELAKIAERSKADAILVVAPYYYKPSQEGLVAHYAAVARATSLPIVLYNIPGRTVVDISIATLERLAAMPSIVAIKESTGNVLRSAEIVTRFGDRFSVLSGDDSLTLPIMAVGGRGVISVASNVAPREVSRQIDLFRAGDLGGSRKQHQRLSPLYEALFLEPNPGPVKAALAIRGMITGELRLPFVPPVEAVQQRIRRVLSELGIS